MADAHRASNPSNDPDLIRGDPEDYWRRMVAWVKTMPKEQPDAQPTFAEDPDGHMLVFLQEHIETKRVEIGRLKALLEDCADRFEQCCVHSGSDPEYAALAVAKYREATK